MPSEEHISLKTRVRSELKTFLIITLFFTAVLGSFNTYRRLILGEVGVVYSQYGISLLEAMILAKIVLIGDAMKPKRNRSVHRSIFEAAVVNAIVFAVLVWMFTALERIAEGLIHRLDWQGIVHSIVRHGLREMIARLIMMFAAFLPFFALWELRRRLGSRRFFELWFARPAAGDAGD